jgi:uncharacterized lipoprotein YddW (UPF0748 family)
MRAGLTCVLVITSGACAADQPVDSVAQWRAIWVDAFNAGAKTPEQIDKLVADATALGLNALIVQVRKRGDALFRRSIEPFTDDPTIPIEFDPLADLLAKAHRGGLQVHAWVNVGNLWPGSAAPPKSPEHIYHKHGPKATGRELWLTQDERGTVKFASGYFLDSGHPDFQDHFVKVVVDLVRNYPVDGVHLDYARYTEAEGSPEMGYGVGYNPTNVERFNRAHRRAGLPDRADPAWSAWRRQQVTQLVRRTRVALLEAKPEVILSAALVPWGDGPNLDEQAWTRSAPYTRAFQDWQAWRHEGLLDLAIPMNYDREANLAHKAFFDHWIAFEKAFRYRSQLVIGVGAYLNSIPDNLNQVRRALASFAKLPGPDGICFYNYAHFNGRTAGKSLDDLHKTLVDDPGPDGSPPPFARSAHVPAIPRLARPSEGAIAGIARDRQGQPLDSIAIPIEPASGGGRIETLTDGNGQFAALFLKPGAYRVKLLERTATVTVAAGRVARIDPK